DLHHEVEMVVALKSGGRNIPKDKALDCVWGYGVGIDLTRRDLQIASRNIKRPWEIGKAFDGSAPCGPLRPASEVGHPKKGLISPHAGGIHTTAVIPPSTNRMCPFTNDDASLARKIAAPCSSSTLPQRPAGVRAHTQAENFSSAISTLLSSVPK